jgi:uncharacterized phage infection (PIP) family protein YhgE
MQMGRNGISLTDRMSIVEKGNHMAKSATQHAVQKVTDAVHDAADKVQEIAHTAQNATDKVQDVAHQVQDVAHQVQAATKQADAMIVGAEKIIDALPDSISQSAAGVTVLQTLDVIQNVLKEADQFAGQMAEIAEEADRAAEQAEAYIARAEQMAEQAEQMADQAEQVLSGCSFLAICGCEGPKAKAKPETKAPKEAQPKARV